MKPPPELKVDVGEAACGLVAEKFTAIPEPIATVELKSVVSAALVVVAGVAYVDVTVPLSVKPVPIGEVPAVCPE